jgi:parvulin-like peptidyl-prolyl isomerase
MNDKTMDETLVKALNGLKVGETSKVIETKSAVYIARIDEDVDKKATEENREAIITERENKVYSEKVKAWQKDDGWKVNESVVEKIDFHNLLTQKDPNAKNTEKVDSTEGK